MNPALLARMQGNNYCPTFERGEGAFVSDAAGSTYLDCLSGYGAVSLGHNHPVVVAAVKWALDTKQVNLAQASISRWPTALAKELSCMLGSTLQHSFFSNSGAEAVEAALKAARKATGRKRIITTENSFHGKTMGALSVTGQPKYQEPFWPLVGEVTTIAWNYLVELERELKKGGVAALIIEPIQGEGGVVVGHADYLQEACKLCRKYGALVIFDEIQTGFGRTGTNFRFQAVGCSPDIICLAKALGGGIAAIGATVMTDKVWQAAYGEKKDSTLHTSTFGGGSIACIAALATLKVIQDDKLADRAAELGTWLKAELLKIQGRHPSLIQEIRGEGLMLAIEFKAQKRTFGSRLMAGATKLMEGVSEEEVIAGLVARELLARGVVTAFTLNREHIIRIAPPLIATREELQILLDALEEILSQSTSLFQLAGGIGGVIAATHKKG